MSGRFHASFPALESEGYQETSPASSRYNCIAWAAGKQDQWWWPYDDPAYFWPDAATLAVTLEAFFEAFQSLGYSPCEKGDLEAGYEKVAIFALNDRPTHAARQLPDGQWTSKLGHDIDIRHTLRGLEGPVYGQVASYLKRSIEQLRN